MHDFRSIYIGCVSFSADMLNELIRLTHKPELVITRKNSNFNTDFFDLAGICESNNIKCLYSNDVNTPDILDTISSLNPDIIFCFGWSTLLMPEILSIPKSGVIGYHPALLPANRGRHPIIWALALGLKKTGSTFFFMDEGADSGDIVSQVEVEIDVIDNATTLYGKLSEVAKGQLSDIYTQLKRASLKRTKQSNENTNSWRKRTAKDGEIDFRMCSDNILNLVKALCPPYPGAHFIYNKREIKVWEASIGNFKNSNLEPGKVLDVDVGKILVKTGDSSIWLLIHELDELPIKGSYLR
jgi:methionyl-tRNA formyltransferase